MNRRLQQLTRAVVAVAALAVATVGRAQVIAGTVSDSALRIPIPGALVILRSSSDSVIASVSSGFDGRFVLRTTATGEMRLSVRHIGHRPIDSISVTLKRSDSVNFAFRMQTAPVILDSVLVVVAGDSTRGRLGTTHLLSWTSRGFDVFERHRAAGKGMFIAARDIAAADKPLLEYFASLPGFVTSKYEPMRQNSLYHAGEEWQPADSYLTVNTTSPPCLIARVDWVTPVVGFTDTGLILPAVVGTSKLSVQLQDLAGVEVYRDQSEAPDEWKSTIPKRCAFIQFWSNKGW